MIDDLIRKAEMASAANASSRLKARILSKLVALEQAAKSFG